MIEDYAYQTLVQEKALAGKDLIIQAPTGAGKTRAALLPGIIGLHDPDLSKHPPRILYSVPMRVLARSFVDEHKQIARNLHWDVPYYPTIQTGESPEDPLFEGRLIFATVDQVLASFLNIPYGLPKKLDNINAGAMIGSYLVFDEFHLYPRGEMMLTVLAMLKMLKGISRFTLMSATFSPVFLHKIASVLGAEVVANDEHPNLFSDIPSVQTQQRTFHAEDGMLTAGRILDLMADRSQCIAVCNTVDRAQALYRELTLQSNIECRLLHSRFYRDDRAEHEVFVRDRFEKLDPARKTILIATQVIEVGLNITSDLLISECAPAASLIQRAGRCARREGEHGDVYIFQPPPDEDGVINYTPYIEDGQQAICEKTWAALISEDFNHQVMRYADEQHLIELTHGEDDAAFIDDLVNKIERRIDDITQCMASREDGYRTKLIRDMGQNVPLYIDPNPDADDWLTEKPWRREAISISKGRLGYFFDELTDAGDADFVLKAGYQKEERDPETPWAKTVYKWDAVRSKNEVYQSWLFAAHPMVVSYSKEIGLELCPGVKEARTSPPVPEPAWEPALYEAERYHEHITGIHWAYTMPTTLKARDLLGLKTEALYPLQRLCEGLGKDPTHAEMLMRLTLALHDVGKLNQPWQAWAHRWQQVRAEAGYAASIVLLIDPSPLAHTDFDQGDQRQRDLQKGVGKRGNHAVEGAQASLDVLREACDGDEFWLAVTLSAIMRHHTPNADDCGAFVLCEGSADALVQALTACGFSAESEQWVSLITDGFRRRSGDLKYAVEDTTPSYSSYGAALMYYVFVRVLRLADQRSGYYWRRYRNYERNEANEQ